MDGSVERIGRGVYRNDMYMPSMKQLRDIPPPIKSEEVRATRVRCVTGV